MSYLLLRSTSGEIADGPGSLLARLEITLADALDQKRNQIGVNHRLNLVNGAGRHVRNGPVE